MGEREDADLRQFELYARDLHELYCSERRRREELAEEKLVLELKLKELAALNSLFQAHLDQRLEAEGRYHRLREGIRRLLQEASAPQGLAEGLRRLLAEHEAA